MRFKFRFCFNEKSIFWVLHVWVCLYTPFFGELWADFMSCSDSCLETVVDKGPKAATESKKQFQYLTDVRKYQTTGEVRDRQSRKFSDTEAAESQRITAWCKYCMISLSSRIKITSEATFDRSNRIVTG